MAKYYELSIRDLKGNSREKRIALARQVGMYLVREKAKMSFKEIGTYFDRRDHTTVLHAYRKIKIGIEKDVNLCLAVETIKKSLEMHEES